MRLSAKLITNYANINQFDYAADLQWHIRAGELNTMYFQLVDLDQSGLRYLAGIGMQNQPYGMLLTFPSIDDSQVISVAAVQANAADSSVWQVTLAANQVPQSGNVLFALTEGANTRNFKVMNALQVELVGFGNDGSC